MTSVYNTTLLNTLNNIDGVNQIEVFDNPYAMRLWIDPAKLAGHDLTPIDVANAVESQSVALSAGDLVNDYRQYDVSTDFRLNTADEWNDLIIAYRDGFPIRLSDVGTRSSTRTTCRRKISSCGTVWSVLAWPWRRTRMPMRSMSPTRCEPCCRN